MMQSAAPYGALPFSMLFWMLLPVNGIDNGVPIDYGGRTITRTTRATTGHSPMARSRFGHPEFGSSTSNNICYLPVGTSNILLSLLLPQCEFYPTDPATVTLTARDFVASRGFISGFEKHNRFSLRRASLKRRPVPDPELGRAWKTEIANLLTRRFFPANGN
jgi:hypothetical protein